MERAVEFIEPDGDLVKLNEMQKEEIAELIQVVPKKKETGKKMLVMMTVIRSVGSCVMFLPVSIMFRKLIMARRV